MDEYIPSIPPASVSDSSLLHVAALVRWFPSAVSEGRVPVTSKGMSSLSDRLVMNVADFGDDGDSVVGELHKDSTSTLFNN